MFVTFNIMVGVLSLDYFERTEELDSDLCIPTIILLLYFLPMLMLCLIDFAFLINSAVFPRCNVSANNFLEDMLAVLISSDYLISGLPLIKALVSRSCLFCS